MGISKNAVRKLKESFLDCVVIFYLKDMVVPIISPDGEELQVNAMMDGYVIDIDQDFYYVGLEDGTILKTVPHDVLGPVELAMETLGEEFIDFPTNGEEVH